MSFFKNDPIEEQIRETYIAVFEMYGVSHREAKKLIKDMIQYAKQNPEEYPEYYGNELLNREKTSVETQKLLKEKRDDGVKDEDIRWWWNMHNLERKIIKLVDEYFILNTFSGYREEGFDINQSNTFVRKQYPIYGKPNDEEHSRGEDRPLPIELKNRINKYVTRMKNYSVDEFYEKIEIYSSMNALIRDEVRKGNL